MQGPEGPGSQVKAILAMQFITEPSWQLSLALLTIKHDRISSLNRY